MEKEKANRPTLTFRPRKNRRAYQKATLDSLQGRGLNEKRSVGKKPTGVIGAKQITADLKTRASQLEVRFEIPNKTFENANTLAGKKISEKPSGAAGREKTQKGKGKDYTTSRKLDAKLLTT